MALIPGNGPNFGHYLPNPPFRFGFQDPATAAMESIINLHNYICFYLVLIFILVTWMLVNSIIPTFNAFIPYKALFLPKIYIPLRKELFFFRNFSHQSNLEILWTIIPSIILLLIAIPSFRGLYSHEIMYLPKYTFKAIGHQWYWSYEFSDYFLNPLSFDSYVVDPLDMEKGERRLLKTDNALILPINTPIRVLVTSTDVLHSFSVNSLGIKVDACPGRLNQVFININRPGTFYGQCSEICGAAHAAMPIQIKTISSKDFINIFNN
jgi:cytochrome c oxidase subunit 2